MLVEGEFVEGDDVFLVAREVVAGGKCQRCGGEKRGEENFWWCPKMYAASNKSVVDIEKSDGKCLNVIEHLLGKTAGFAHRAAYPLA